MVRIFTPVLTEITADSEVHLLIVDVLLLEFGLDVTLIVHFLVWVVHFLTLILGFSSLSVHLIFLVRILVVFIPKEKGEGYWS